METEFLSVDRAIILEESINLLSNYSGSPKGVKHVIGNSLIDVDEEKSIALEELGNINNRRDELIKFILKK